MKRTLTLLTLAICSNSYALGVWHFCTSDTGTWVSRPAVSSCFFHFSSKVADRLCVKDYRALYPKYATWKELKKGVYAASFYSKDKCEEYRVSAGIKDEFNKSDIKTTRKINGRTYTILKEQKQ